MNIKTGCYLKERNEKYYLYRYLNENALVAKVVLIFAGTKP